MARQLKGSDAQIVIDFENDFSVLLDAGDRKGWIIPIVKDSVASSRKLKTPTTLRGSRNPVEPDEDNLEVSGSKEVPLDAHNFGLMLRGFFGLPVSSVQVPAQNLDAGAAVNLGSGKVGIPCAGHGLSVNAPIVLSGTTHYDGGYTLQPETTDNQLVIVASFTAETFTTTETVTLARHIVFSGVARNAGSGMVGLTCAAHGLPVGAHVVIAGSTNYNGSHTVQRGSSADEILITATYEAESFSGAAMADAPFYDHTYKIANEQPSITHVKGWPNRNIFFFARGCKLGKLPIKGGGAGEITTAIDVMGAGEDKSTTAYAANLVSFPLHKFLQRHLTITLGGVASTKRVTDLELNVDFALDGDTYTINTPDTAGERGDINEGTIALSGTLKALFKDSAFADLALAGSKTSIGMLFTNGGYQLQFDLAEMRYERTTPGIDGPKGIVESYGFQAWLDTASSGSAIVTRLRNEIYTWEE